MPPIIESLPGLPADYTIQFFQYDVITKSAEPAFRGKVVRCWADEEGLPPPPLLPGQELRPLDRPLLRGEVGIQDMDTGELMIVPESILVLVSREFLTGDVVKRSLAAVESAVVTGLRMEFQLEHVISKQRLREWVPMDKVESALKLEAGDRIVYDHWVGIIEEVFEIGLTEKSDGMLYLLAEMGGVLEPGRTVAQVTDIHELPHLHGPGPFPPGANPETDKIIEVRAIGIYITWTAIDQMLSPAEQGQHPEPKKCWAGEDIKKLTHIPMLNSLPPALFSTVVLKSPENEQAFGVASTSHAGGTLFNKTYKITQSRSLLTLRWQDGKETQDWAHTLVPYRDIDDYECWPGELVVWRGDNDERRPACVQAYNPHQRIAEVAFLDDGDRQTVSVLELDRGASGVGRSSDYGAGFGQRVLLCKDNGSPIPNVPTLGQVEAVVDDRRWGNMQHELHELAEQYSQPWRLISAALVPQGDKSKIDWWGEVHDLHYDGTLSVKLASGRIERVGVKQIVLLAEPAGDMLDEGHDDMDAEISSEISWETLGSQPGNFVVEIMPRDDILADGELMDAGDVAMDEDADGVGSDGDMDWEDDDEEQDRDGAEEVDRLITEPEPESPSPRAATSAEASLARDTEAEAGPSSPRANGQLPERPPLKGDDKWVAFEMLEEAPEDHHFIKEPLLGASKAFSSRLQKEHRALMSSLPENILVRTYESRTDLLRCLIIGPEGTPYADAPFVFDVYLNPTKFPHSPPSVYFHSHTNGKGRCNPNLYEDGKVCLSILGTWSGDKSESWNPQKSSLLQVFVSISGLVLVRSPYHCEPAFARLEGTKEGAVNARLYSEKAYVLSRSFVRTALERPPSDLAAELRHLYYTKRRLQSVIDHAQRLISKGEEAVGEATEDENAAMWNADAMGSLTMGAILSLKRTITSLQKLLEEGPPVAVP